MFVIKTKMEGNILNNYSNFVKKVTSKESNELDATLVRLMELNKGKSNMSLLLTSSLGLSSESGEFNEIVKKIIFQGKPLSEDNIFHMKRELGDIIWYWIQGCRALNVDPNEIISMNIEKLESRYPGGKFDAYYSENRKEGDL